MNATNDSLAVEDGEESDPGEGDSYDESMVGVVPQRVYLGAIYFILVFGILGNACVLRLMHARDFQNMSYPVYLRTLAVIDSLVLVTVCTDDILDHQFGVLNTFSTSSVALCKLWYYAHDVVRLLSPWLIVALTFDRFVAVVFPLRRALLCSRRSALVTCCVMIAVSLVEASYNIIFSKPEVTHEGLKECTISDRQSLINYIMLRTLFHTTTFPLTIILVLNVVIIVTIRRSARFRRAMSSKQPSSGGGEKSSGLDKVTLSLSAVSLMAFCTLLPVSILQVIEWAWEKQVERLWARLEADPNSTEEEYAHLASLDRRLDRAGKIWPALNLVCLVNFGQNFYVMLITGHKYRKVVASWFHCLSLDRHKEDKEVSRETKISHVEDRM